MGLTEAKERVRLAVEARRAAWAALKAADAEETAAIDACAALAPRDSVTRAAVYDAMQVMRSPAARVWIAECAIRDGVITAEEGRRALDLPLRPREGSLAQLFDGSTP